MGELGKQMALELLKEEQTGFASAFRELIETHARNEPAWLRLRREKSFAGFEASGLPTVKDEDWKYTNLAAIARTKFAPVLKSESHADLKAFRYDEMRESTLVFVNGVFQKKLSAVQGLAGAAVLNFTDALASSDHELLIREHYARQDEHGFAFLNSAFSQGLLIAIPANTRLEVPIHLLFVTDTSQEARPATFPRVLIVAEENSSATVLESYTSANPGEYLTNSVIDLILKDGAHVQHYKVQREAPEAFHIANTTAALGANANYDTTTINFGAALSRHGIEVLMDHEGAQCSVDGLYMVDGNQHTDTHSVIDHRQPRCASHQLYKGILDGKSRAVFNGKVFVRHGAQQTDAKQTNKNLLLSPEARVDTKPQLEIFADDVKCAHGAAVGQLDQEELFYLESRGIRSTLARNLLTYGFAEEVIEKIKIDSIKRELDEAVLHRLRSGLELQ
jgi:Fe-S cluster assembly protein SufD